MNSLASPLGESAVARASTARDVFAAIVLLGACAAIAQLALIRELMGAFSGNELIFGVAFAAWLVLTAAGTWLGRRIRGVHHPFRFLTLAVAAISVLPVLEILAIRGLRDVVFAHGVAADPIGAMLACGVVLAPFCLASGALLIHGSRILADPDDRPATGRIYAADAIGSIVGAAIFTFVLAGRVEHVAAASWSTAAAFSIAAALCVRRHARSAALTCAAIAVSIAALAASVDLDGISTGWQHRRSAVVWHRSSPYGRVVVTRAAGQLTFFDNGVPVGFSANAVTAEEIVHYALAQRLDAASVLMIGGSVSGAVREALRYPAIRSVTCIELDPQILAAENQLLPRNLTDARIRIVVGDGRRFIQRTRESFDVVIVALPDPTTFQLNRFYTSEFFAETRHVLTPTGVLALGLGRYENYVSPELAQLLGSGRRTLASAFGNVVAIPGGRVFLLASPSPLHRNIAAALEQARITPQLVNRDYLDAMLTPDRLADIDRAALTPAPLNTDFHPILYLIRLRHWLSQFAFPAAGLGLVLVLAVFGCLVRFGMVPRMIFASGFAASALEVAALVAIQVFYGSMYRQVGIVMAVFMTGLAIGSAVGCVAGQSFGRWPVPGIGLAIALLAACFALVLPAVGSIDEWSGHAFVGQATVWSMTLLVALLVGLQFALASDEAGPSDAHAAPRLFSADLVGAALGAVVVSAFMLPMWGLTAVCFTTAGLNLLAAGLAWWTPRYR